MSDISNARVARQKQPAANTISKPIDLCSVDGCNEKADIRILVARNQKGYTVNARDHDLITAKHDREGKLASMTLRSGYRFIRWVTRCASCYALDVESAGRSARQHAQMIGESKADVG